MRKHITPIGLLFIAVNAFSQTVPSSTENYVYTKTYLSKPGDPVQKPPLENIQYLDGLGRPKQVVNVKASPKGNDIVTPIVYDGFGRELDNYLPVPMTTSNGAIQNLDPAGVVSYYTSPQNTTTKDFALTDANPFSHKVLESSPLDRIQQQVQVGNAWSNKPVIFDYDANKTTDKVMRFWSNVYWPNQNNNDLKLETSKYFGDNQLYKNTVTDEDGNATIEFKNSEGQTLLIRKMLNGSPVDTYYVYNEYNQLSFVISPEASSKLDALLLGGTSALDPATSDIIDNLCYRYKYDGRNRLIEKKLPGKGWEYMVYDKADRLVLTQDANLGLQGKWLITKYDKFGRVIYTGTIPGGDRLSMQNQVNSLVITEQPSSTGFIKSGLTVYYTNGYFVSMDTVLSVNYYDTYPPDLASVPGSIQSQAVMPQTGSESTKSLPTASFVKNIEDDQWTKNYTFYDQKVRAIGSYSYNHLGGYTKTESVLDFTGLPQKTLTYHKRISSNAEVVLEENFTYDNQNRLTKHTHQVNSNPVETLTLNHYNEIGQLDWKKVGGTATALQTIDYKYNIRGWLSSVNDPANATTMGTDLFGYRIRYNETIAGLQTPSLTYPGLQVKSKYNGNIAEIDWNAVDGTGELPYAAPLRYGYVYDGLNRLQAGFFQDPTNPSKGTNNEIIEQYDLNGNIIKLKRFAYKSKSTVPAKIDDLTYNYTGGGNKVTNIADASGNTNGYEGGNALIQYDANGNMTVMPDKGITNIAYNFLNLPKEIAQVNNTKYYYRADGVKIKKTFILNSPDGSSTANTEYLDGFQYVTRGEAITQAFQKTDDNTMSAKTASEEETFVEGDNTSNAVPQPQTRMVLSFFPTAEGFYDYENSKYIYQYKDHLGNVRVSYALDSATGDLEIQDRNDFYPFGMNFNNYYSVFDAMGSLYNYKFGTKELQETGFYDFGARMYMSDIGRWGVVDPLAEKYTRWSPFNYAMNNPIRFIDPDGRGTEDWVKQGNKIFFDASVKSQADASSKYGETAQHLGEGSTLTTKVNGVATNTYTFHDNGTVNSNLGPLDNRFDHTTEGGTTIISASNPAGGYGVYNFGAGLGASAVEQGAGISRIGSNYKLYTATQAGRVFYGNQYVKTYSIGGIGKTLGTIGFGAGIALDTYGVMQYSQNPASPEAVSPAKAATNTGIGAWGLLGGPFGVAVSTAYGTMEAVYPGGLEGAMNDNAKYQSELDNGVNKAGPNRAYIIPRGPK